MPSNSIIRLRLGFFRFLTAVALFLSLSFPALAQTQAPEPIVDWQKRLTAQERLTAFGDDLMGDKIDRNIGSLVFNHTDVSLPGNNGLNVSISRRLTQGYKYDEGVDVEFGDWELEVPKISTVALASKGWAGQRCNGTWEQNFPQISHNKAILTRNGYMDQVNVSIPGQGSQSVLRGSHVNQFPSTAKAWTVNQMYFTCTIATDGKEGFIGHAPNGDKYYFTKFISRNYKVLGFARSGNKLPRVKILLAATKVVDVHGNYVNYTYLGDKLIRIQSSDDRVITLSYTANLISSVTANGRKWSYSYRNSVYAKHDWDPNNQGPFRSKVLDKVTQPDGRYWEFDLDGMQGEPSPTAKYICGSGGGPVRLKHPAGAIGNFALNDIRHRSAYGYYGRVTLSCSADLDKEPPRLPGGSFFNPPPPYMEIDSTRSLSVTSKSITHPNMVATKWTFEYEEDKVCGIMGVNCGYYTNYIPVNHSPAGHYYNNQKSTGQGTDFRSDTVYGDRDPLDFTNWTKVTQPDGTVITYYHIWTWEEMFGGQLIKTETHEGSNLIQEVDTVHIQRGCGQGSIGIGVGSKSSKCHTSTAEVVTRQDGDTFTSKYEYNMNPQAVDYSFGSPVKQKSFSNLTVSSKERGTDTSYTHNKPKWILGLPKTIYEVGSDGAEREMASYEYDDLGQKLSQKRYGVFQARFGFNNDGTPNFVEDALGRRTEARNWKAGKPQKIVSAVGTPDETEWEQIVDVNGWLQKTIDPLGYSTLYNHDIMGRVTQINPTGNFWDNTDIAYDFPSSGGAVQTITKGQSKSTVTYDSMFRPTLERTQALDTGWSSYVNTTYDALGRVTFTSQPSTSPSETKGVDTTYDGLGRVYDITENVAPYAQTRHRYYNNHRHRIYDPSGAYTQTYSYGYGGPGNTDYRLILKLNNSGNVLQKTELVKNQFGQLTTLTQSGTHDNKSVSKSQHFKYDAQQRLCRHFVPEHGATVYRYDDAGQMTGYIKGLATSSCGFNDNNIARVSQTYDALGRPIFTDFKDPNTPDITRSYDDNGNVRTVNRGTGADAVNWTYAYNDGDFLASEQLDIDGRSFTGRYFYTRSGHLRVKNQLGGHKFNYEYDGLGRMLTVKRLKTPLATGINYHPSGSVHQMTYGNDHYFSQTLNNRLLPERLLSYSGATKAIDQTFGYDARGLVTSILDGAVSGNDRSYGYDGLGYLKTASGPWGAGSYKYDSLGNLREKKLGGRTVTLNYNAANNRLSQSIDTGASGTRTVAYDNRGNVTTLGNLGLVYDKSDQPVAVSGTANGIGSANGTYRYDGNLKRVKSIVNGQTIYNIYDAGGALVHIDKATEGERTAYVTGPTGTLARITNGAVTYLHPDHLGSAQAGTSQDGSVKWREQYTPFGEQLQNPAENDNLDGFTGHIKDKATGLNYMQARYYDPVIGRFLSIDPVTFMDTGNPAHFNRYTYGNNDPINMFDPDGRMAKGGKKNGKMDPGALAKARADFEKYKGDNSTEGKRQFKAAKKKLDSEKKFQGEQEKQKRRTEFKKTKSLGKAVGGAAKGGLLGLGLAATTNPADELLDESEAALDEPQELTTTVTGCKGDCDMLKEWGWVITDPENNEPHPEPEPKEDEIGS